MKESIDSNRILGVADDKGANKLIINSKCIMIMMSLSSPFKVFYIPQVFYCVKQMSDILNIIHRFPHTTLSNKEIQLLPKADMGILQINIKAVIFNLYQWFYIIIHHKDTFVNP